MADTPEKKMKRKVDAVLKANDIWFFAPQSGIYGRAGIPDRVGIAPGGGFLAVEVKAPDAKRGLTALQERTIVDIINAGGVCFVVRDDEGLNELDAWIKTVKRMGI